MKNIIKNIIIITILSFIAITCLGTESENMKSISAIGTVKYISLEGGFYGITTDDNKNLDPLNLSKEFQVDGKRISFKYVEKKDMASIHMWGTIVEIIEISGLK